jgi:hypothetical protein
MPTCCNWMSRLARRVYPRAPHLTKLPQPIHFFQLATELLESRILPSPCTVLPQGWGNRYAHPAKETALPCGT